MNLIAADLKWQTEELERMKQMKNLTPPSVENLRKASQAVYLATSESVAKDISQLFIWAADRIEELERQLPKPVVHHLEAAPLESSPPEGGPG